MSDQGGRRPPTDDRTLLDPLNADELKALREARAKMQAAKHGNAAAHQVVIGPDAGEDIGDAPTRAMPALPQFESSGATLDRIPTGHTPHAGSPMVARPPPQDPAMAPRPQQPMSHAPTQIQGGGPPAGPTGFGENTLLWMAPPKPPVPVQSGPVVPDNTPKKPAYVRAAPWAAAFVVLFAVVFALYSALAKKERAVIDLHTNPPRAQVKINGKKQDNVTPIKLGLFEGTWEIDVSLEGYKPHVFSVTVEKGQAPSRRDIELEPISEAGKQTVVINVQPVAANITLNGTVYPAKRALNVPNIDPTTENKIVIEAGGYVKIEQLIPAGQLKKQYNFILQQDETQKPQ